MSVQDTAIWERFIAAYPDQYDACQYDFHVGDAPPFNTLMDNGDDLNQDKLYRLRIDVVGHKGTNRDIIEIKPNAGASAIGQVLSYQHLFERDGWAPGATRAVLITDKEQPNMAYLCKQSNIWYVVI